MAEMTKFRMFFYISCFAIVFTASWASHIAFGITVMIVISVILYFPFPYFFQEKKGKKRKSKGTPEFMKSFLMIKLRFTDDRKSVRDDRAERAA